MEWVTAWSGSHHGVGHIVVAGLTLITSVGYKSYHCVRWSILGPTRTPGRTLLQLQPYACPSSFIYNFILLFSNNLLSDTPYRSYYRQFGCKQDNHPSESDGAKKTKKKQRWCSSGEYVGMQLCFKGISLRAYST